MKCNAKLFLRLYQIFKKRKQKSAFPEIMIPLVSTEAEIKDYERFSYSSTARKVQEVE